MYNKFFKEGIPSHSEGMSSPDLLKGVSADILPNVQSMILQGHGRNHVAFVFLSFTDNAEILKQGLTKLAFHSDLKITTGVENWRQRYQKRHFDIDGGINVNLYLSAYTYEKFGLEGPQMPTDSYFQIGMSHRGMKGSLIRKWDQPNWQFKPGKHQQIDALYMIANDVYHDIQTHIVELTQFLAKEKLGKVLFVEEGIRGKGSRETFGFVDGISQPPILNVDKKTLRIENRKIVLDGHLGSYVVFQKWEQDKEAFDQAVKAITWQVYFSSQASNMSPGEKKNWEKQIAFQNWAENIEAQIMGRFKDGTPISVATEPIISNGKATPAQLEAIKAFNEYESDPKIPKKEKDEYGSNCPFFAHIRKVNPRTSKAIRGVPKGYNLPKDPLIRIVRRGIPYSQGKKKGLLFLSFQASIQFQFLVLLGWANDIRFPKAKNQPNVKRGIDPIIGRGSFNKPTPYTFTNFETGKKVKVLYNFRNLITLRGGEYFYAPSLDWFRQFYPDNA